MTDEATITDDSLLGQAAAGEKETAPGDASNSEGAGGSNHEFVLDKYRAEGRTEQQALEEQAKGYGELQTKFGSFTGAPEAYDVKLSDEIVEQGIEINTEDPLFVRAKEFAKESNMSQEGFNQMVNLHIENQLVEKQAVEELKAEEFKSLGSEAASRIDSINSFIGANFDEETVKGIQAMATSADSIQALEALIGRSRSAPIAAEGGQAAPAVNAKEVEAMQFELDDHGGRRINSDPGFKAEYKKKLSQLHGDAPHRVVVGG